MPGRFTTLLKNPALAFTAARYLILAIQVMRGILIAKYLGPELFGIWGFILLVKRYAAYTGLGIQYAINIELSTKTEHGAERQERMICNGITINFFILISLILFALLIHLSAFSPFSAYSFGEFIIAVSLIVGFYHLEQILVNIYRVYGRFGKIVLCQLISAVLPLATVFIFSGKELIHALLTAMIVANVINLTIYFIRAPFKIRFLLDYNTTKYLVKAGFPLLLYNLSDRLIYLAGLTIVSIYFLVQSLGYYTLGDRISTSIIFGLESVSWVFLPLIMSRVKESRDDIEVRDAVEKVTRLYTTLVFLIIFVGSIFLPLLFMYLKEYTSVLPLLQVLLVAYALRVFPIAYNSVAIVRGKTMVMALFNIIAFVFTGLLGVIAAVLGLDLIWIAGATLVGVIVALLLKVQFSSKLIGMPFGTMMKYLNIGTIISFILCIVGSITGQSYLFCSTALLIYFITNHDNIRFTWNFILENAAKKRSMSVIE